MISSEGEQWGRSNLPRYSGWLCLKNPMFPQPAMFQVGRNPIGFTMKLKRPAPVWSRIIRDGRVSNKMRSYEIKNPSLKIPCLSQNPIKAIKYQVSITFSENVDSHNTVSIEPSSKIPSLNLSKIARHFSHRKSGKKSLQNLGKKVVLESLRIPSSK